MALQRMNEHTKKKKPSDWIYRLSSSCDWFLHVSRTYPFTAASWCLRVSRWLDAKNSVVESLTTLLRSEKHKVEAP
jgi:hypothetical protein